MSVDYRIDGQCPEGCAKCCAVQLPISKPEIKKVRQYIRRNKIEDSKLGEDKCPFLNEEGRCRIYIHRFEICKFYSCGGSAKFFNHRDKNIVDLRQEFYGNSTLTNTEELDKIYQVKKEMAYGK